MDGSTIFARAAEEAATWLNIQLVPKEAAYCSQKPSNQWQRPPSYIVKCNMSTTWIDQEQKVGYAWVVRDSQGIPLSHSRRAFAPINSLVEAELRSLQWVIEALRDLRVKRVILEISSNTLWDAIFSPLRYPNLAMEVSHLVRAFYSFEFCHVNMVTAEVNVIAKEIVESVIRGQRYQSYVANGGPRWLSLVITSQARESVQRP